MRLLKWSMDFDIHAESPICLVWLSLPNLRIHFFDIKILQAIGSLFGRPLQVDQATTNKTRPSVARILVEIDITKEYPKEIWLGSDSCGYSQKVEFDKFPIFCSDCKLHGHDINSCFVLNPELKGNSKNYSPKSNPINSYYTWSNNRLWQRLDRILFNQFWIDKWPLTSVEHLSRSLSYHCPLLISIKKEIRINSIPTFRFQNMWILHNNFSNIVEANWNACLAPDNSVRGMVRLWMKLKRLKHYLNWWNKNHFKNIFANIKEMEKEVCRLEILTVSDSSFLNDLNIDKDNLVKFQDMEETYWKQKSASKHISEGDRNTKYFHALVNKKKSINFIDKIRDENGNWISDTLLHESVIDYFSNIFCNEVHVKQLDYSFLI
ncbi:hypothetical protein MA16_Dca017700 [Dendrobium catenatum]|uniref:Uncharacterized protein n=1 Tax=Dendrobium catenatum TaxID=906689 RepID=A0A2I0WAJ8_9ASPA|nr:hypothetical protein MA16_Dca017700 [Dendrobium catenatum]